MRTEGVNFNFGFTRPGTITVRSCSFYAVPRPKDRLLWITTNIGHFKVMKSESMRIGQNETEKGF